MRHPAAVARKGKTQSPYCVDEWGGGYFLIGRDGHLRVRPFLDDRSVDLTEVVRRCAEMDLVPPLLVRFPQLLQTQLQQLYICFQRAMAEFGYTGHYRAVFPLKVNPRRPVVESLIKAGRPDAFGLEVGSKTELAIALSQKLPPGSWICINGFKDAQVVELATVAAGEDPTIVLVVERLAEIPLIVAAARKYKQAPVLGLRCRLDNRGSGRWEASGGETSKFGLGSSGLLCAIEKLREAGLLDRLRVLHYHIGSQITSVRRIKDAVKESARIYARLRSRGIPLQYLNVGGGLGIDYDGSNTPSDSSVNYSMQEFANNVVYTIQEVCTEEEVPLPDLVSESGRAIAAHHALLITNCESRDSDVPASFLPRDLEPGEAPPRARGGTPELDDEDEETPPQVAEIEAIAREISIKNFREYYHDALMTRGEVQTLFDLGYLSLEQKAVAEQHFYTVCRRALEFARRTHSISEELKALEKTFRQKYVTNFSVFRSVPDAWAIEQLFPIVPIHRLNETPTEKGILVDLTCDSDGVIDAFVDVRDVKEALELHAEAGGGKPYLLAICLLGAYQEIMGAYHNLFGNPPEVSVSLKGRRLIVESPSAGESIAAMAELAGYDAARLRQGFTRLLRARAKARGRRMALKRHERIWNQGAYLEGNTDSFRSVE